MGGEGGMTRNKGSSWSEKFAQIPRLKSIYFSLPVSRMPSAGQIWWAARDSKTQMEIWKRFDWHRFLLNQVKKKKKIKMQTRSNIARYTCTISF